MIKSLIVLILALVLAQPPAERPLIFPVATDPGPSTWLFGQPYGNSVGAYNFGTAWYSSGQGLHFGIDISMPCGTPLVAVADGTVAAVDNLNFGSGPHNLILRHEALGIASLYGHLLNAPSLRVGQQVTQGEVIATSGDPDVVCDSRPHLHYEVRSLDYWTTYNPVNYIDINWHNLAITGGFNTTLFQGDMDNARRWMTLEDQPPVTFGGARLNVYQSVFPAGQNERPASNALLARDVPPLPEDVEWTAQPVAEGHWMTWWHPTNPDIFYTIDGAENQRAAIFEWSGTEMQAVIATAPPTYKSPDGTHEILRENGGVYVHDLTTDERFLVATSGETPSFSVDNSRLLWIVTPQVAVPGAPRPLSTVWVSDREGNNARQLFSEAGVSAAWLDDSRLLVTKSGEHRLTTFLVYDTADDTQFELGSWTWIRNVTVSPGGKRIMFYRTSLPDAADNGIYTIETIPDAGVQRIDWFGGWRWRDADSVYYIPLDMHADHQILHYYHIPTGEDRVLTSEPFIIMNGDWDVSPDGQRILFHNAIDNQLWIMEMEE